MNCVWAYEYVQNTRLGADGEEEPLSGELLNPEDVPEDDPTVYSKVWNGYYRKSDIEYLDDYYSQLEDAFVLDNINIQDYARKVAKASLIADRKYNEMRNGGGSPKEWQDAQSAFDAMCKSANFAACQRKDQGSGGLGSLAKIIEDIEINHRADMPEVHFPPDDVDRILQDFRHTFTATQ